MRKPEKGERHKLFVDIDKVKKGVPTIIYVSGRRYVYDPKTQNRR